MAWPCPRRFEETLSHAPSWFDARRRLALAAAALAGCNKSASPPPAADQAASTAAPAAMSDADKAKALAALPAPYNTADLANGESKFALCSTCHTLAAGRSRT